jgi:hypothetical protein
MEAGSGSKEEKTRRPDARGVAMGFLFMALLFGAVVRLWGPYNCVVAVNDGGMFYVMVKDLLKAGYALPAYTSYNSADIPFAYPPLAFYLTAFLSQVAGVDPLAFFRWLPALLSIFTIPAFFLCAWAVLESEILAGAAAISYALLPRSFHLLVMGGGLTRAAGDVIALLLLAHLWPVFMGRKERALPYAGFLSALLLLSHPQKILHTAVIVIIMWLFCREKKSSAAYLCYLGAAASVLTAPWWLRVLLRHGVSPFLNAASTGNNSWRALAYLVLPNYGGEVFVPLITACGMAGLLLCIVEKKYLLPAWLLIPFFVDPRGAPNVSTIPLAMLAGVGLVNIVIFGLSAAKGQVQCPRIKSSEEDLSWAAIFSRSRLAKTVMLLFVVYTFIDAQQGAVAYSQHMLSAEDVRALQWVRGNTPEGGRFVLIDPNASVLAGTFHVPQQEWFPALAERINLGVVQGYEWLGGKPFSQRLTDYLELQECRWKTPQCIESWAETRNAHFDYILVKLPVLSGTREDSPEQRVETPLAIALARSEQYQTVYSSASVRIFARQADQQ